MTGKPKPPPKKQSVILVFMKLLADLSDQKPTLMGIYTSGIEFGKALPLLQKDFEVWVRSFPINAIAPKQLEFDEAACKRA